MKHKHLLILTIGLSLLAVTVVVVFAVIYCCFRKKKTDVLLVNVEEGKEKEEILLEKEGLIRFEGAEDLTLYDILEAPGEVIGKSSYGTLYRADLLRKKSVLLLRFLRPACTLSIDNEVLPIIKLLGSLRHPNLVPMYAFYLGSRGEKLMVHPFYLSGNLAQLIRDGNGVAYRWEVIYRISIGIAKALNFLHTIKENPIIHGNLKSKNILLDRKCEPYLSDFGLHLLLTPSSGQQMLDISATSGYTAPELIKSKDNGFIASDVYSFGVIMLELLTRKKPIDKEDDDDEHNVLDQECYLPNGVRNAVLNGKMAEFYHPDIVLSDDDEEGGIDRRAVIEDCVVRLLQLSMVCCSSSPSLRPDTSQILAKLQQIGKNM